MHVSHQILALLPSHIYHVYTAWQLLCNFNGPMPSTVIPYVATLGPRVQQTMPQIFAYDVTFANSVYVTWGFASYMQIYYRLGHAARVHLGWLVYITLNLDIKLNTDGFVRTLILILAFEDKRVRKYNRKFYCASTNPMRNAGSRANPITGNFFEGYQTLFTIDVCAKQTHSNVCNYALPMPFLLMFYLASEALLRSGWQVVGFHLYCDVTGETQNTIAPFNDVSQLLKVPSQPLMFLLSQIIGAENSSSLVNTGIYFFSFSYISQSYYEIYI